MLKTMPKFYITLRSFIGASNCTALLYQPSLFHLYVQEAHKALSVHKVAARKLARLVDLSEKTACDWCITDFNWCNMAEYLVKTYTFVTSQMYCIP